MTPEEYLVLEDASPYRSEFYDGAMIAMTDRSYDNAVINSNLIGMMGNLARQKPWRVLSSAMRVCIEAFPLYTYPDASVIRGHPQLAANSDTTLLNPCLIVEVLSPSGRNYERRATFQHFQKIDALRDYVQISQEFPHIGCYAMLDKDARSKWVYTAYAGLDAVLLLPSLSLELPLRDIYEGVEFPAPGSTASKKHPDHDCIF